MGTDPEDPRLGRLIPDDWRHVDRYPLSALSVDDRPTKVPVVGGFNWYPQFDVPTRVDGDWWIARGGPAALTRPRGGHCVCLEPGGNPDVEAWWLFYDQGREGACVGYGFSRAMTLLNRRRYAARWLWDQAKLVDEWPDTNPGDDNGTSLRAAAQVLAARGHVTWARGYAVDDDTARARYVPQFQEGISAYRWARSIDEVHTVLGNPEADKRGALPILNSWGRSYPRLVWMPDEVADRLLTEDGEWVVPTDR